MTIRLKILRRQMGWSLEAMARQTGLTKSYLSKVERGLSVPSIAVALKLSKALRVDVEELFSESRNSVAMAITRAADRTPMGDPEGRDSRVEGIAASIAPKRMLPFVVYPPQDFVSSAFKEHEGEEFLFVHKGVIEIEFPSETVRLKTGDSIYFNALIPHRTRTIGRAQAEVLVVISQEEDKDA